MNWNEILSVQEGLLTGEVSVEDVDKERERLTKELRKNIDLIPEERLAWEAKALFDATTRKSELEQYIFYCSAPFPDVGPPPSAMMVDRRTVFWQAYFSEQWAAYRQNHELLTRHAKFCVSQGSVFLGPPDNKDGASLFRSISNSFEFFHEWSDDKNVKKDRDWHLCRIALLAVVTGYADIGKSLQDQGLVKNDEEAFAFWTAWFGWYQTNFWFLVPQDDGWRWRLDQQRKASHLGFVASPRTMDIAPLSQAPDFMFTNGVLTTRGSQSDTTLLRQPTALKDDPPPGKEED